MLIAVCSCWDEDGYYCTPLADRTQQHRLIELLVPVVLLGLGTLHWGGVWGTAKRRVLEGV